MDKRMRSIKLCGLILIILSVLTLQYLSGVSAHEGHKNGHAPVSAKRLRNPLPLNNQNVENGKELFNQYCAVCHGMDGKGTIYNQTAKIKVPDLSSNYVANLPAGSIFYVIGNGIKTSGMPAFKLNLSMRERWQMVHYVQQFGIPETITLTGDKAEPKEQEVSLRFKPMVGTQPFKCGESYTDIGRTKSTITPTDFRLYIHNIRLIDNQGKEVAMVLEQDDKWQYQNLALLDFENGEGPCANGTVDMRDFVKGKIPAGKYNAIKFSVGVPFELNHADPAKQPSPLNLTQMFWIWNAGYKFMRIEVNSTGMPQGWFLHLGSTSCSPHETLQTVPTSCEFPNRPEVILNNFNINEDTVVLDLKNLFDGANVDINQPETVSGCMSSQVDSDCAPLFANLGLAFSGQQNSKQKFFVVEKGKQLVTLGKMKGTGR